jgi:hypothetical protein
MQLPFLWIGLSLLVSGNGAILYRTFGSSIMDHEQNSLVFEAYIKEANVEETTT